MAAVEYAAAGTFTFTWPTGVTSALVECVGGGSAGHDSAGGVPGAGGGEGAYASAVVTRPSGGTSTVVVGAGAPGHPSTSTTSTGGTSSFDSDVSAVGGVTPPLLNPSTANFEPQVPGTGGVATSCVGSTKTNGHNGVAGSGSNGGHGGQGGPLGGTGGTGGTPTVAPTPGTRGGGGAGAASSGGTSQTRGASGGDGVVRITYNTAPNAPTLTSPADDSIIGANRDEDFTWTFDDPDVGDTQSEATLQYRVIGAGSWTQEVISGATATWTAVSGTFTEGDDYEWQVKTKDTNGPIYGPFSASSFFTAGHVSDAPTVTEPTSGDTIVNTSGTVSWEIDDQQAWQVRLLGDDAGDPDETVIQYDSGPQIDSATRDTVIPYAVNNFDGHVMVRAIVDGLWTDYADVPIHVEYTEPPVPTVAVTIDATAATLTLTVTNPTPTGDQPDLANNEVWVNDTTEGWQRRAIVAENGSWTYQTPASATDYDPVLGEHLYVLAVGTNGSGASSADDS